MEFQPSRRREVDEDFKVAIIVLAETAAILVLEAERVNPAANIVTGQDAVW
jgi:hypothetical protein